VGIVSFLGNSATVIEFVFSRINSKSESLTIIQSRLRPYRVRPDIIQGRDDVFLQLQIRNYGASAKILTAADIEVTDSGIAKPGGAHMQARCSLSGEPNNNTPIKINPGDTVWITFSHSVNLPGLADWLSSGVLDGITAIPPEEPFTINQIHFIKNINEHFSKLYGSRSKIHVKLYEGNREDTHQLSISLTDGKDMFSKDGSLQQDWFIARWLYPNVVPKQLDPSCTNEPN
jgi:hypothetical protein